MKSKRRSLAFFILSLFFVASNAQDIRTLETRVADLLARLPAENSVTADQLMEEMYLLGDEGTSIICRQIVPAGKGDDSRARYAVNSLTYYLSKKSDSERKIVWEKQCIGFMKAANDPDVCRFFMSQLGIIGAGASVTALTPIIEDSELCSDAVRILQSIGSPDAQKAMSAALLSDTCPCSAQIMYSLGEKHYSAVTDIYTDQYKKGTSSEKAAALFALAGTGNKEALTVLTGAAEKAGYKWDPTNAVQALLLYAKNVGLKGDIKTMGKITSMVLSKSNSDETVNQRIAALSVIVVVRGEDAFPVLVKAIDNPDVSVRRGVAKLASPFQGPDVTKKWISRYHKVHPYTKSEIISILGEQGDTLALPLIKSAMSDPSSEVSVEALSALAKIDGTNAAGPIIDWILKTDSETGHWEAAKILMTILDRSNMDKITSALTSSRGHATVTLIYILSQSGEKSYFKTVSGFLNSDDIGIRAASLTALKNLASCNDQLSLINLLEQTSVRPEISELQAALAAAAHDCDKSDQTGIILSALDKGVAKLKLIPVLSVLGGDAALKRVWSEFVNGNAGTREVCFDALQHWSDISATPVLFEICKSGDMTYAQPAFDAYMRLVASSDITDENKILLLKKIAALALSSESRKEIVALAGSLNIYQAYFFVSQYLKDDAEAVRRAAEEAIAGMNLPEAKSFISLFNGSDLTGWKGLVSDPIARAAMKPAELLKKQNEADQRMLQNWGVKDGVITFNGEGDNLCSVNEYGDYELFIDWKITKKGDSGIYLRGTPQVQIWDTSRVDAGAQVGSGGLYNNQVNPSIPLLVADNPVGEWNNFRILMIGDIVSVWLNGKLVTDKVIMENYWDRSVPLFETGSLELQAHGTDLSFRDILLREIKSSEYNLTSEEKSEGFVSLFNGRNLNGWQGDKNAYTVTDGVIVTRPHLENGGNIYTEKEYSDFVLRFDFELSPGANNGLGIRTPLTGDPAYVGMELQILDNTASIYADLHPWQYHGSVYGVIPAKRGFLKPVGEWNSEEVVVNGTKVKVILNGTVIVDGDIADESKNGTVDGKDHPGLKNPKGYVGFLYHDSLVKFRNIRIRELR